MRKKILVLSAALVLSANLHAQVTIGSVNAPKAGAILDLNSGAKGGLVLSNVGIDHPTEIPAGFPGVTPENTDAAKAGLKGAMIYNTNENTCIGVHAWNGDYWERIAPSLVMAPGTTLTSPNATIAFGGDIINFTASLPGAKTYRWYASENNGDYEYHGITTTNTWSKDFPTGNHKVKVIMDDCHAPAESNELSFSPASISPYFGSLAGGNYIYIYGDFKYAGTGDYIQDNLVVHYDAINNQALGDKSHSYIATDWKDLKNADNLPLIGVPDPGDGWKSNAFKFSDSTSFGGITVPASWPQGNADRTIEITFKTPAAGWNKDTDHLLFYYGTHVPSNTFSVMYRYDGSSVAGRSFYFIGGHTNNYFVTSDLIPALYEDSRLNTVTSTYSTNVSDPNTKGILNGTYIPPLNPGTAPLNTGSSLLGIGTHPLGGYWSPGFEISSVRLYRGVLSAAEIQHNADLDQIRYLDPPIVTIGGVPCSEVVVLSPHFLMCKVPAGSALGAAEVKVGIASYGNVYKYVDPDNAFYVSSISPIIGDANTPNQTLTLKGNNLDKIVDINVGGQPCTDLDTPDGKTLTCILPSNPAGEVDIIITMDDATIYRFAKVFEFK
jgi:hypothetical protein